MTADDNGVCRLFREIGKAKSGKHCREQQKEQSSYKYRTVDV